MASTASPSLKLELIGTGDQSGTWGVTTNTNLGTLLEQAITGYQAIAKVGTTDYTLSNTDYAVNENRNAVIEFTGTPGGAFNVIVPNAEKLWVFKNSTNGAMTIKTSGGTTTVTVATSTSRWVFCDGAGAVYDALTGTLATQSASSVAITGGTITGLTSLTMASGVAGPTTNDGAALGTGAAAWSDLFLADGAIINFGNGDVTITEGVNTLAFAGGSSGYTFDAAIRPAANDGAALGASGTAFSDLFLASGGVVNFDAGDVLITHSANTLAFTGATSYTFDAGVTISGGAAYYAGGTDVALADGGTGASLTDPNADRIMFWDDSASAVTWLTAGSGLTITDTTLSVSTSGPFSIVGNGVAANTQTFNATGTWTKPASGNYALVFAWGGGGGAARSGGGGGAFTATVVPLSSLGATVTVTIGAGGTGNNSQSGGDANVGGTTSFGTSAYAYGGGGGGDERWTNANGSNQSGGKPAGGGGGGGGGAGQTGSAVSGTNTGGGPTGGEGGNAAASLGGFTAPLTATLFTSSTTTAATAFIEYLQTNIGDAGAAYTETAIRFGGAGGAGYVGASSSSAVATNAGTAVWGGGGGGLGDAGETAGGTSTYGGAGGAANVNTTGSAGAQPGGGGGGSGTNALGGAGGAGKVIVYVY